MLRRTTAVLTAALVLGAAAAPAALAKGPTRNGGKKPIGIVASFDGTTLTVTLNDGSSQIVTADDETRIKIDHRGRPAAKGNPVRGSLDDLVAGAKVLRMKIAEGDLDKIRIRRAATESAPAAGPATACVNESDDEESDEEDTDTDETDDEESEEEETDTDESDEESDEEETDTDDSDDEESEEETDTDESDEDSEESDAESTDECDDAGEDDEDEDEDEEEQEEEEEADLEETVEEAVDELPVP